MSATEQQPITAAECGRRGAQRLRARLITEAQQLGIDPEEHVREYYRSRGKLGGESTYRRHGSEFLEQIGIKGGTNAQAKRRGAKS